jgi:hypothetical protein
MSPSNTLSKSCTAGYPIYEPGWATFDQDAPGPSDRGAAHPRLRSRKGQSITEARFVLPRERLGGREFES